MKQKDEVFIFYFFSFDRNKQGKKGKKSSQGIRPFYCKLRYDFELDFDDFYVFDIVGQFTIKPMSQFDELMLFMRNAIDVMLSFVMIYGVK